MGWGGGEGGEETILRVERNQLRGGTENQEEVERGADRVGWGRRGGQWQRQRHRQRQRQI